MSLSSRIFVVCLSVFQKEILKLKKISKFQKTWASVKRGEGAGWAIAPPHFHDDVLGAPATLKKGALNYLQEKGCIIGFLKQMVLEEQ